jgi:hypothetical protein
MVDSARYRCCALTILLTALSPAPAADDGLTRAQLNKLGKPATALVEVKGRGMYGSAFCIHSSGLFLTNEHVAQGELNLILDPGLKTEKVYRARVVRSDKQLDLALLRIDDVKDLPTLALGSDDKLEELMELVAFGFPFGTGLSTNRREYPAVSVNVGSITSLRRKDGELHRIQLDAALNPGNSGGPVLDKNGKVVGIVVAGVQGSGVNFAIPVGTAARFLARPDIQFDPPRLVAANVHQSMRFEARVVPILPTKAEITVELTLKPDRGKEKNYKMKADGNRFHVTAVPVPAPSGDLTMRLIGRFGNGAINATATDRAFKVGDKELKLSEVHSVRGGTTPRVLLADGKSIEGKVSGLDAVPVRLGEQTLSLNLAQATEVEFAPAVETNMVWYTLLVRQGDKEVLRQSEVLLIRGLLPAPAGSTAMDIKPPALEEKKVVRKLSSEVADVAVGGGGRYLVLHLPKEKKLAVFDVNAAKVVGHIPVNEEGARFTAGREDVVVVLPGAGTIERWSLKTLERDVAATLPIKGVIKAIAMGSASRGPLLVHWARGKEPLDRAAFTFLSTETMKVIVDEVNMGTGTIMGSSNRNLVHLRASANGRVFGLWCTSHTPSGMGAIVYSDTVTRSFYMHGSVGHVVPSPDGKILHTRVGSYLTEIKSNDRPENGIPEVPACHGDYFLSLAQPGKKDAPTINSAQKTKPIATLTDVDLEVPKEDTITHDFTFDKRVHLIPEAKLLITIPSSNDQLILCRFGD